jgi:hypothetical protein
VTSQTPTLVWKVKEHKKEKIKKVSFAVPIATELKAPKITIPDDSIMFIKGIPSASPQIKKDDPAVFDYFMLNSSCPEDNNTTQHVIKEKEGGQTTNGMVTDSNILVPSEKNSNAISVTGAPAVEFTMSNTVPVASLTELEAGKAGVESQPIVGLQLGTVLGHLEDFLVSSPPSMHESNELDVVVQHLNFNDNNDQLNLEQHSPPQNVDESVVLEHG